MRNRAILLAAAVTLPIPAQSTLRGHDGDTAASYHGFAAAGIGDVDRDGFDDYAVGASNSAAGRGEVLVYSGATGRLLRRLVGQQAGSRFGWSLAGLGDINGDGVPDLAVGAPFDSRLGFEAGMVTVHSGADGAQVWSHFGLGGDGALVNGLPRRYGSRFGWSMVAIDDLDGDGVADLAAGAPSHVRTTSSTLPHNVPYVEIRSGATGTALGDTSLWRYRTWRSSSASAPPRGPPKTTLRPSAGGSRSVRTAIVTSAESCGAQAFRAARRSSRHDAGGCVAPVNPNSAKTVRPAIAASRRNRRAAPRSARSDPRPSAAMSSAVGPLSSASSRAARIPHSSGPWNTSSPSSR
jgi:hypothetical protein